MDVSPSLEKLQLEQDSFFLTRLQQLEFSLVDGKTKDPSQCADLYRNVYFHLQNAAENNENTSRCLPSSKSLYQSEADEYLKKYAGVVDNMESDGLNNFAEGALALCQFYKNESAKWETSLNVEEILAMPYMQTSLEKARPQPAIEWDAECLSLFKEIDKAKETRQIGLASTNDSEHQPSVPFDKTEGEFCNPNRQDNQMKSTFEALKPTFQQRQSPQPMQQSSSINQQQSRVNSSAVFSESSSSRTIPSVNEISQNFPPHLNQLHKSELSGFETGNKMRDKNLYAYGDPTKDRFPSRLPNSSPFNPAASLFGTHHMRQSSGRAEPQEFDLNSHDVNSYGATSRLSNHTEALFGGNFSNQPCHGRMRDGEDNYPVRASSVGGPYANFGQKKKSSQWSNKKNWGRGEKSWMSNDDDEDEEEDEGTAHNSNNTNRPGPFRTAKDQLAINQQKKFGSNGGSVTEANYGSVKKSLGTRRGPASKFVPPVLIRGDDDSESSNSTNRPRGVKQSKEARENASEEPEDERLKGIDPKMIELINNEIMDTGAKIGWEDIAGLEFAKKTIKEIVVWPMLRPDIFTGLRGPPKGLLLFGPPGTGKTLIGKCIASQSRSTFFCISASSLTSKWVGEGEKMVRALFAVARCHQPAVVFIDEIDSLLSQRSDSEHESSRRIKTEFLVQLDGAATESEDRILVIGATNRPQEIDEAARRRFVKRLLIPLPEAVARRQIVINLMAKQNCDLSDQQVAAICDQTEGYSGADMTNLCREAALGPIRSIPFEMMETITAEQVRPISYKDFEDAVLQVRASVSDKDLELYTQWNRTYGSFGQ